MLVTVDKIRRLADNAGGLQVNCSTVPYFTVLLQGFLVFHAFGGGTGYCNINLSLIDVKHFEQVWVHLAADGEAQSGVREESQARVCHLPRPSGK